MDLVYSSSGSEKKRVSHGVLAGVLAAHAGVLFALATSQNVLSLVVEQPILVSLVAPPEPQAVPRPLPVKPQQLKPVARPSKNPVKPPVDATPQEPEPQLATKAAGETLAPAPEQRPAAPAEELPPSPPAPSKVTESVPQEEPIEQPRFNADYLDNPAPAYPALSRKLREQGRVLLRVHVDTGGHPAQVALYESSGYARLDERAADTVRRWKFQPARQGGQPVEAWVIIPIQFSLKG